MRKVYTSDDVILSGHIHSLLTANGIACFLRNMTLSSGIGELPINECWPEVWIHHDVDYLQAQKIIKYALSDATQQADWQCCCGQLIEGQFGACWSCGAIETES